MAAGIDHNPKTDTFGGGMSFGASGMSSGNWNVNNGAGGTVTADTPTKNTMIYVALAVGAAWLLSGKKL